MDSPMFSGRIDPEGLIRLFLERHVPDANREGLAETPARFQKAFAFWLSGYEQDPAALLKVFEDGSKGYDQMVTVGGIALYSLCEHHLAPFFGVAHVGYIPSGKIVGLSKIARLVEVFSRRLQVQERLSTELADCIEDNLRPLGVGVVLRCRHLCMESRGVQKPGAITITSALRGVLKTEPDARAEFLEFVKMADRDAGTI